MKTEDIAQFYTKKQHTCKPTVMLNKAILFFPCFKVIGLSNLKEDPAPFPDELTA